MPNESSLIPLQKVHFVKIGDIMCTVNVIEMANTEAFNELFQTILGISLRGFL